MLIDLTDVIKNGERGMDAEAEIGFDAFVSKLGEFPIVSKSPISLHFQNRDKKKVWIEGSGRIEFLCPCSRCLTDVKTLIELDFKKEISLAIIGEETAEALEEHSYLDGYNLDVDKLVYGEILLNWPMQVLCVHDCKGICSICGINRNLEICSCDSEALDPRMAKIRDIFSKFKEV